MFVQIHLRNRARTGTYISDFKGSAISTSSLLSSKRTQKHRRTQLHVKTILDMRNDFNLGSLSFLHCFNSKFWPFWFFFSPLFFQNPNQHVGIALQDCQYLPWGTAMLGVEGSDWRQRAIYNAASLSKGSCAIFILASSFIIHVFQLKCEKWGDWSTEFSKICIFETLWIPL